MSFVCLLMIILRSQQQKVTVVVVVAVAVVEPQIVSERLAEGENVWGFSVRQYSTRRLG